MPSTGPLPHEVRISTDSGMLQGDLCPPSRHAGGMVLFVDAAGRHGAAARRIAQHLHGRGIGTLLMDLHTPDEQQTDGSTTALRMDLPLLTVRVQQATAWLEQQPGLHDVPLGYVATGSASAAAVIAAAKLGRRITAMVLHGGRPDLAETAALSAVTASTLLLANPRDVAGVEHIDAAYRHMRCERSVAVVPARQAGDDPQMLEHVGEMAADWLLAHFMALEEVAV